MKKIAIAAIGLLLFAATVRAQIITEVDLSIHAQPGFKAYWPKNYYVQNTSGREGFVGSGLFGQLHDSRVIQTATGTYLVVTAFGLGDVYKLDATPGPPQPPSSTPLPTPPVPPAPPAPLPPPPPVRPCSSMNNLFVYYGASTSGCSYISSAQCATGEEITFNVGTFGYDLGCAAHVIAWNFGDQSGSSSRSPTHIYRSAGTYQVSLSISSQYEFTTRQVQIKVADSGGILNPAPVPPTPQPLPVPQPQPQPCPEPIPPPPCPTCQPCPVCPGPQPVPVPVPTPQPVPPTPVPQPQPMSGCPAPISGQNIDLFFSGDTCNSTNGEPCDVGEAVTFSAIRFQWFSCGARTLAWDFGDGSTELTTDTGTRHRFARPGTYEVRVTVSVEGRATTIVKTVSVEAP